MQQNKGKPGKGSPNELDTIKKAPQNEELTSSRERDSNPRPAHYE